MPHHVVNTLIDALKEAGKTPKNRKIAVLGYSFKGGTDDTRNTPVQVILELLRKEGVILFVHDPHVKEAPIKLDTLPDTLQDADCVLLTTDHSEYSNLDLDSIASAVNRPVVIVDCRHILEPRTVLGKGYVYRGIGRPTTAFDVRFDPG
jgi:UDP-N-acetyl-D-mannosaminuronic acid dehydrogenase